MVDPRTCGNAGCKPDVSSNDATLANDRFAPKNGGVGVDDDAVLDGGMALGVR